MAHLTPKVIDLLLEHLLTNLHQIEALLLLGNLFDLHYHTIFLSNPNQLRSRAIVRKLYEQASTLVSKYSQ